ncbi:UDP-4-amino-4,6-dideoxy-N-acetyl-beta-L-altrosamine N-acetyltransferase [Marinobacterium sp. xm-d-564]|uniref:UDP-4-amino-4, 6-dideoxy-N-acetyl-beta-L-altrosamine N-acetyltransferase n=1 Tax=Marinobacterium sp. xm-d-564 TaxID=2497742 RepID=UPI001A07A3F7|nr:UDP-4-amino-4,6-dideoxy-N-acetyl-beta-L-altrosamine N-acetyltransferase [Marinobacterium sp. xm-d-564]NRP60357.1 UDP-4-amino-4,6-dideoxy-N-acetyl-beta-L-altrosamine N-acetyltransferase [Marinobacterium sp. xm-d-564]
MKLMNEHRLRQMVEDDLEQVLEWRNHPEVRINMYSTHEIRLDEHRGWFANASNNPAVALLIYVQDGKSQGFVNITRTRSVEVADWGFYLSPDAPKGSGSSLGKLALNYAFAQLNLHKVCGQALGFNTRSIAFHKRLGFTEEGCLREHHFDGIQFHDVLCFGLLSAEWRGPVEG